MVIYKKHNRSTGGLENKVRCPWCGTQNDHTKLADLGGREVGTRVECDNEVCGNIYVVVAVHRQPTIQVKQYHPPGEDI